MSATGLEVEVVADVDLFDLLESTSTPLSLSTNSDDTTTRIALFEALTIGIPESSKDAFFRDGVLFGGGLCNTLDWCPLRQEERPIREFLALSCHAKNCRRHCIGTVVRGQGLIQIWTIEAELHQGRPAAQMALGIVHEGGICSCLQWCPDASLLMKDIPRTFSSLGLLAMALGNGDVQIVAVPEPNEERQLVHVEPWIRVSPFALSGSLVSCLDWHPAMPHDLLLMGSWNGSVTLWALPFQERGEAQLLLHHSIDSLALRRVVWLRPPPVQDAESDALIRHCFCSVGHSGHFTIWNRTNMFQPLLDWTLTRWWLMDADVSGNPLSVFIALEDASIRQLPLEMSGFTNQLDQPVFHVYSGLNKGTIHAICCSPCSSLVSYGGEDGEIAVFAKENVGDTRYRKPHICAGAMKFDTETETLRVITASDFRKIGGVYIGGAKFASKKPKAEDSHADSGSAFEHQTVHCLRFSPNGQQTTWLAAGCANGCIRILRITE